MTKTYYVYNMSNCKEGMLYIGQWVREWKIKLTEKSNPEWDDLYSYIADPRPKTEDGMAGI